MMGSCEENLKRIDDCWEQLTPVTDPQAILTLVRAMKTVDDTMRRALGLSDLVQSASPVTVNVNSLALERAALEEMRDRMLQEEPRTVEAVTVPAERAGPG
jgi:hypothetical protein